MSDPSRTRILFVDDEQAIRDMLARHFGFLGYPTLKAQNGREALKLLETEAIEIVVTDLVMPVMGGVDLMRELRANHPTVGFVAMTGHVELQHLLTAMRLGAADCVFKPFQDLAELEFVVEELVERHNRWQRKLAQLRHVEKES